MRTLIVFSVVGLALGLAAQLVPRAPREDGTVGGAGDARALPMPGATTAAQSQSSKMQATDGFASASYAVAKAPRDGMAEALASTDESNRPDEPAESVALGADAERDRIMRLIAAGFTHERAVEIVRKGSQLRREAIEREYAATGTIRALNSSSPSAVEQQLRREMGDGEYEKYLEATGQSTRIRLGDIETDSAAANAGFLPGDEIVEYAGRRVFSLRELNALMLQTPEGEAVATTVVRDGQPMKLYVTGGALGISQARLR